MADKQSSSQKKGTPRVPASQQGSGKDRGPRPAAGKGKGGGGYSGGYRPPGNSSRVYFIASAWTVVAAVLVVVIVLVVLKVTSSTTSTPPKKGIAASSRPAPASLVNKVTHIPQATFNAVGISGDASQSLPISGPIPIKGQPPLVVNGKPAVVYIGAEYCPFCAAERWPMVIALSRFGTFSNLRITHSGMHDVFAGTKTFSFYKSTYTSPYLVFEPVETYTNQPSPNSPTGYLPLQAPTSQQNALISKYDGPPYTGPASSSNTGGAIPFIDLGNRFIVSGASYTPSVLSGFSRNSIASELYHPSSILAKLVDGSANYLTAAICVITHNQPANVCSLPVIIKAKKALGAG